MGWRILGCKYIFPQNFENIVQNFSCSCSWIWESIIPIHHPLYLTLPVLWNILVFCLLVTLLGRGSHSRVTGMSAHMTSDPEQRRLTVLLVTCPYSPGEENSSERCPWVNHKGSWEAGFVTPGGWTAPHSCRRITGLFNPWADRKLNPRDKQELLVSLW